MCYRTVMGTVLRLLRLPFEVLLALLVVLDETVRPLYRPLLRWIGTWRFMAGFEAWVAAQHRFFILFLLSVPFVVAEPLKILGLIWIARDAVVTGTVTLALAYLAGFVLVERIYRAGEPKLMTIGWFAELMRLIVIVREAMLGWVRQTAAWRLAVGIRTTVRRWLAS